MLLKSFVGITIAVFAITSASGARVTLNAVPVDPLIKVFQDSTVVADSSARQDSARGEHATWQIVVTSSPVEMLDLRCDVTTFTANGQELPVTDVRYVGYVASSRSARRPAHDQLRPAPGMFPDPLLEDPSVDVAAGHNQPLWVTVNIPEDAEPGEYNATAVVTARIFGRETSASLPLELKVYPATITDTRLNINNWLQMWHRGGHPIPEQYSPEWWGLLRTYVRNMVEHRQNWARVETLWLIKYGRDENGKLTFDFSNFDRWVNILFDEGIETVQSLQFAWRMGKWSEPFGVEIHDEKDAEYLGGKAYRGRMVAADSPEAKEFYSQWFPAFRDHLKEKGWLDNFVQAVGDEPVAGNADSYTTASNLLKQYAPELQVIEACLAQNMVGAIDIWVPTLEHLHQHEKFFNERREAGDRIWFYTCVQPEGEYANRFVELPLLKTRIMHWINYRYDVEGYLHWGYNFWRPNPWENAADADKLQGGDTHIVYPAKDGFGIVESIRWEAMRDGIEDHELLSQLGETEPEAAMELARRHVQNYDKYDLDVEKFRATRRELLQAVSDIKK